MLQHGFCCVMAFRLTELHGTKISQIHRLWKCAAEIRIVKVRNEERHSRASRARTIKHRLVNGTKQQRVDIPQRY